MFNTGPSAAQRNHDICKKIGGRRKRDYHERLEGQWEVKKIHDGGTGRSDGHTQTELPATGSAGNARQSVRIPKFAKRALRGEGLEPTPLGHILVHALLS
jgi:hypothetical protein